jgi:ribosomal protein S18 acetylase RimI-like enzyme
MNNQSPERAAIHFRRCTAQDRPFLRRLYGTTREDEMRIVPWTEEQKQTFLDGQFEAQTRHYEEFYPDCDFLMIELEGVPIGRLYLDRGEEDIRITDIALLPEYRGRGIGRMLIEEILEEGRSSGRKVTIHVEHFNPALRLYNRLGFRPVDSNGIYHLMEWRAEDR